jgi:hypothetical protein
MTPNDRLIRPRELSSRLPRDRIPTDTGRTVALTRPTANRVRLLMAPDSVTSVDPRSRSVPSCRNQPGPWRAISARCASVSTFCMSVGGLRTPRSNGRGT